MEISDFKTGQIVLIRSKGIIPFLIRFFTKYRYNHVEVIVHCWDVPFTVGAIAKGVISRTAKDYYKNKIVKIVQPKFAIDEKEFARRAMSIVGITGYDYGSLFIWGLIYQLTGFWFGKTKEAYKRMYCSEYGGWCYSNIFPEYWFTDPEDLGENEHFETFYEGKLNF